MKKILRVFHLTVFVAAVVAYGGHDRKIPGSAQVYSGGIPTQEDVSFDSSWDLIRSDPRVKDKITKANEDNLKTLAKNAFKDARVTGKAYEDFAEPLKNMFNSEELEVIFRDTEAKGAVEKALAQESSIGQETPASTVVPNAMPPAGDASVTNGGGHASADPAVSSGPAADTGAAAKSQASSTDTWKIWQDLVKEVRGSDTYKNASDSVRRDFNKWVVDMSSTGAHGRSSGIDHMDAWAKNNPSVTTEKVHEDLQNQIRETLDRAQVRADNMANGAERHAQAQANAEQIRADQFARNKDAPGNIGYVGSEGSGVSSTLK